jgi:hypothetical protein
MPIIQHGNIKRRSRINPEFTTFRRTSADVAAVQAFDYIIPFNRDLQLSSAVLVAEPTGAESAIHLHLTVRPPDTEPGIKEVIIAHAPGGAAAVRQVLNFVPGNNFYIPRNHIIRLHVEYSAGALAKNSEVYLIGWLVPAFDMSL